MRLILISDLDQQQALLAQRLPPADNSAGMSHPFFTEH
jgi:hypothetical protein